MLNYLSKFQIDVLIDNCKTVKRELKKQKGTKDLIEIQDLCIERLTVMRKELTLAQIKEKF
jgi:hypothetical protein